PIPPIPSRRRRPGGRSPTSDLDRLHVPALPSAHQPFRQDPRRAKSIGEGGFVARFQSKEEYERWRSSQRGGEPAAPPADDPSAPAAPVYAGHPPGSSECVESSH